MTTPDISDILTTPDGNNFLYTAKDALQPPPPLEWCVDGLLPLSSVSMLVGAPGSKKTFLAIDLAVCVAMGKPWLGKPLPLLEPKLMFYNLAPSNDSIQPSSSVSTHW